ncbi:MAG: methionine adenosyltransferase [Oscillospiraceae bacterium]|nr:methionine adenosyltransferase [Oscillospiraceae bacterium]
MRSFTSEQVSCGHPDKVCDRIADSILDAYLEKDPLSRVAVEVLVKNEHIILAGEITGPADIERKEQVASALDGIGLSYDFVLEDLIFSQSPDIAMGVDSGGAGDQGIMFGYACDETSECLPLSYMLATDALKELRALRHPLLGADAKSQVTVRFDDSGVPSIDTFLISTQHSEELGTEDVRSIAGSVMERTAERYGLNTDFRKLCNPTGRFVIGGSFGDAGVTGRKIICDTYGGGGRHGGGAFSGKDPTKVDRSAAYMARYLAKHLLRKYELKEAEVQLSYAIGMRDPISVAVKADGKWDGRMAEECLENFDLTPAGIISFLKLREIRYSDISAYGHFTNQDMPWEKA